MALSNYPEYRPGRATCSNCQKNSGDVNNAIITAWPQSTRTVESIGYDECTAASGIVIVAIRAAVAAATAVVAQVGIHSVPAHGPAACCPHGATQPTAVSAAARGSATTAVARGAGPAVLPRPPITPAARVRPGHH